MNAGLTSCRTSRPQDLQSSVEPFSTAFSAGVAMAVAPFAMCIEVKDMNRMVHINEPVNGDGS